MWTYNYCSFYNRHTDSTTHVVFIFFLIRYNIEQTLRSVPLPKFCQKMLPHAKCHWNRTTGCWVMGKKTVFNMAAVRYLECVHVTAIEFQICCGPHFVKVRWFLDIFFSFLGRIRQCENLVVKRLLRLYQLSMCLSSRASLLVYRIARVFGLLPFVGCLLVKLYILLTQNTLEVLWSLLRPIVQWHILKSKNHLVSSSPPLGRGCNRSRILHSWPSGVPKGTK